MRMLVLAAALSLGTVLTAHATEPLAPVQQQLFSCGAHGRMLMHVAFIKETHSCCASGSGCAEALSTMVLAKPHGRIRT